MTAVFSILRALLGIRESIISNLFEHLTILDNLPEDCLSLMLVRGMCSSVTEPAPGRIQVEM